MFYLSMDVSETLRETSISAVRCKHDLAAAAPNDVAQSFERRGKMLLFTVPQSKILDHVVSIIKCARLTHAGRQQ
jgi:hypothetical protein